MPYRNGAAVAFDSGNLVVQWDPQGTQSEPLPFVTRLIRFASRRASPVQTGQCSHAVSAAAMTRTQTPHSLVG